MRDTKVNDDEIAELVYSFHELAKRKNFDFSVILSALAVFYKIMADSIFESDAPDEYKEEVVSISFNLYHRIIEEFNK